jgi:hypothetical protein
MSAGFGFSVGDFIAGINLVRELIDALDDAAGASAEYRCIVRELFNLESALIEVKHLSLHESQKSQKIAVEQAAFQCQETIDQFLKNTAKYRSALGWDSAIPKWRSNLRKMQWALNKSDDLQNFRATIAGHTLAINTLLSTIQL